MNRYECQSWHLVKGVLLLSGGWRRGAGLIAGMALRLNEPGQVILSRGLKAADVRHAGCGWRGEGLAALWLAAAGPWRMCGGSAAADTTGGLDWEELLP